MLARRITKVKATQNIKMFLWLANHSHLLHGLNRWKWTLVDTLFATNVGRNLKILYTSFRDSIGSVKW